MGRSIRNKPKSTRGSAVSDAQLATKADAATVSTLTTTVDAKASQADLDSLATTVNAKASITNVSPATAGELTGLTINNVAYTIPSGGGGASTFNELTDVSTTGAAEGDPLVYNSSNQWVPRNPLYVGQSFGMKMGQRSGAGSGQWGSSSSWVHLGFLQAQYAAPFNLPNDYDEEFGHYRQLIKFPNGTVDYMDINSSSANEITLPYDGYYFYCGSFTQRTGATAVQHQIWALQNGAYRQVSPNHFRNYAISGSGNNGSLTYAWCMYFPAGVTIRVYQFGHIHRSGGSARTGYNQFTIHYMGETYGTNVYGTYYY